MSKETDRASADREVRKWMKKRQQARMGGVRAMKSVIKLARPAKTKK